MGRRSSGQGPPLGRTRGERVARPGGGQSATAMLAARGRPGGRAGAARRGCRGGASGCRRRFGSRTLQAATTTETMGQGGCKTVQAASGPAPAALATLPFAQALQPGRGAGSGLSRGGSAAAGGAAEATASLARPRLQARLMRHRARQATRRAPQVARLWRTRTLTSSPRPTQLLGECGAGTEQTTGRAAKSVGFSPGCAALALLVCSVPATHLHTVAHARPEHIHAYMCAHVHRREYFLRERGARGRASGSCVARG